MKRSPPLSLKAGLARLANAAADSLPGGMAVEFIAVTAGFLFLMERLAEVSPPLALLPVPAAVWWLWRKCRRGWK